MVALVRPDNQIAQPQKSNEWYTPARYIEAARLVMGGIDLDPASCELANQTVRASRYYSKEDDGLSKPWYGRVWLNPPYRQEYPGHSSIKAWSEQAVGHYENGHIKQAILLVPNDTSTRWFERLWNYAICFPSKRIKFEAQNLKRLEQPTFGTCFVYLGPHEQKFIDTFSEFGTIAKRVSPPKSAPSTLWEVTL